MNDDADVDVIALIAERKIRQAMEEGEFNNLPGAFKPLPEDDLAHLPPEVRLAMRILRNSGFAEKTNDDASDNFGTFWPDNSEESTTH
ncbi:MAG: DUF1992 domain-containing protein [Deltaproteobacteria bacterium]|jgi:hypothetical protein|nr:DUF1992 domain-containing protein [Deltaproteobacteria bacterium]